MKKSLYVAIDALLKPRGFRRQEATWNRTSEPFVDVIEVQTRKARDAVFVNVGVLYPPAYEKIRGEPPPPFVEEPNCTARTRLGPLIDGLDQAWRLDDPRAADDLAYKLGSYGLPFVERMHSVEAMEQFLIKTERKPSWPGAAYLAALKVERGDTAGAREVLRALEQSTSKLSSSHARESWHKKIEEIMGNLNLA